MASRPCVSISTLPKALPTITFGAENPAAATSHVLEQIWVHGNVCPWCGFAGMWPHVPLPNATGRRKVLCRVTQNLCNPKRDVNIQENAGILERSTAWPPLSKCRAGLQHWHRRTTTAMAGCDPQASRCTSCSWGCSTVSAHSGDPGPLGPITAGAMHVFRRQDSENRYNIP